MILLPQDYTIIQSSFLQTPSWPNSHIKGKFWKSRRDYHHQNHGPSHSCISHVLIYFVFLQMYVNFIELINELKPTCHLFSTLLYQMVQREYKLCRQKYIAKGNRIMSLLCLKICGNLFLLTKQRVHWLNLLRSSSNGEFHTYFPSLTQIFQSLTATHLPHSCILKISSVSLVYASTSF